MLSFFTCLRARAAFLEFASFYWGKARLAVRVRPAEIRGVFWGTLIVGNDSGISLRLGFPLASLTAVGASVADVLESQVVYYGGGDS